MLPAMKLPAGAVSVSSDGAWRLLAVCRDGSLHVWDLQSLTSLLQASLHPLLASTTPPAAGLSPVSLNLYCTMYTVLPEGLSTCEKAKESYGMFDKGLLGGLLCDFDCCYHTALAVKLEMQLVSVQCAQASCRKWAAHVTVE